MNHIKKHLPKTNQNIMKKGITTLVLLFFAMVMIFQKDTSNGELQFVRNSNESLIHNAANDNPPPSQRDYLFQNEAGNDVYQGQITDGQRRTEVTQPSTTNMNTIDYPDTTVQTNTGVFYTGNIITGELNTRELNTGELNTGELNTRELNTGGLDCITPWNEQVKNQDFILAYEQRRDVNTICNIEKRTCFNGTLGGTFTQRSCREDMVYTYRKAEIISYNQKVLNEFIQPPAPVNAGAEFTTEGKINETNQPTDTRGTTNSPVITKQAIPQTPLPQKSNCTTPRGQTIKHGQFIKAYKAPRGFIDLACNVEIRACVNGQLKGNFRYSKCTFNNTTYAGYLQAGLPTSNAGFLFFQRIKAIFSF